MLVTAISSYDEDQLASIRALGAHAKVLCSPNITVGINFLIMAARLLREIAPLADVEILEQHFRGKPEVSGTARKIAESLSVEDERIIISFNSHHDGRYIDRRDFSADLVQPTRKFESRRERCVRVIIETLTSAVYVTFRKVICRKQNAILFSFKSEAEKFCKHSF